MAQVIDKRVTAELEGAFVVFLVGMRINKFRKAWKWLPSFFAMPEMVRELDRRPGAGFLGASSYIGSPRRPMLVGLSELRQRWVTAALRSAVR